MTGPGPRPSWADELLDLAAQEATGRLVVLSSAGDEGWVEFRDGELVGVSAASRRPLLARRLTAFGVMAAPDVAALLSALRAQTGRRLIDVLVHDRLVPDAFITGFVRNTMAEQLGVMAAFPEAQHHFRSGPVHQSVPPQRAEEVLATALAVSHTFPQELQDHALKRSDDQAAEVPPVFRSVLEACDGSRSAPDVADACGLTVAETVQVLTDLRNRRLVGLVPRPAQDPWQVALAGEGPAASTPQPTPPAPAPAPAPARASSAPPVGDPVPAPAPATVPTPAATAEPPIVLTPLAPEPVEPEPVASDGSPESRRAALNALADLTEAVAGAPPVPHVPPVDEPQSEVTTTSPRVWANRPMRPANPMESGDVLRELKSLGD